MTSTLAEIKKELRTLPKEAIVEMCIRIARHKKENKELLSYLVYDANNEMESINHVKLELDEQWQSMNSSSVYFAKKTIRKVLRTATKYSKFSGHKATEAELLIYFLAKLHDSGLPVRSNTTLHNISDRTLARIRKGISTLHEDLQHDLTDQLNSIL